MYPTFGLASKYPLIVNIDKSGLRAERVNPSFAAKASLVIGWFCFTKFIISSCLDESLICFAAFQYDLKQILHMFYEDRFVDIFSIVSIIP